MNKANPSTFFGGTWEPIVDRFLYCVRSSSGETDGSKKISVNQLPRHNHEITNYYDNADFNTGKTGEMTYTYNSIPNDIGGASTSGKIKRTTYTDHTGLGLDYMPPYMTVYAWYRTG